VSASEPLAHLYDLALRALDEQERRTEALRGRLGPVLAAAALGASLLGVPSASGARPAIFVERLASLTALVGLMLTLGASAYLLRAGRRIGFDDDPTALAAVLARDGLLDDPDGFYAAMILRLGDHAARNTVVIERLLTAFTAMLCGILVMLCGLAAAAIVG
jgi:hypothetical protein